MKILYDCFSASPYYGSDEGIGFTWPYLMSRHHEVWALVRSDRREDIERFLAEHPTPNLHFVYCEIPKIFNIYYYYGSNKTSAMRFLVYQYLWQYAALRAAKKLHREIGFDLVHHVCTNDFRLPGFMHKLNISLIIGPIGGAQETPEALSYYVRDHKRSEKLRTLLNKFFSAMPAHKKALNRAAKIYVSNRETWDFIEKKVKDKEKIEQLTEVAYLESSIPPEVTGVRTAPIFMWAGRMEYRKGLELLIDVATRLPEEREWQILLCGDGTERAYYEELVEKAGLSHRILFKGKLPYEEVQALYGSARAFVFPSLRETTGTVIIEAMAHGVPVICLNQGGGAYVVSDECGFPVNGTSREEYIENFARAMCVCMDDAEGAAKKGAAARERIAHAYTWERKIADMCAVYEDTVTAHQESQHTGEK